MQFYEEFLAKFSKSGKAVRDLSRIASLLSKLGDPQERLRFVHIAGTNGKGSVAHMTAAALHAAGYKTGLLTSPYIIRYNDRIMVDGEEISDERLNLLAKRVSGCIGGERGFSQFEITQAMAFLHFAEVGCDIVVLEAGIGGRLDSTNIIKAPVAAVICSISLDHTALLGDTVAAIAEQKAGIIKSGSAAVLSPENPPEAVKVIRRRADSCGVELIIPLMDKLKIKIFTPHGTEFSYNGCDYHVAMGGYHQVKNAITVIELCRVLEKAGFSISDEALRTGLSVQIPARLQILSRTPPVIVDGGHNPEAVEALAKALTDFPGSKRYVVGMLRDKDVTRAAEILTAAAGENDKFICVGGFYPNCCTAQELCGIFTACGANAEASTLTAQEEVRRQLKETCGDTLVICGSFFLASLFADGEIIREVCK